MSFEDFARNFTQLDLVHVGPDDWMLETALHSKQPWRAVLARRRWRSGYNAGGGPTYIGIYILYLLFFNVKPPENVGPIQFSKKWVYLILK